VNIIGISKLVLLAMLIGILAAAPVAIAIADDLNPDSSDSAAVTDSSDANQVLEIPQQCDQGTIGNPCDSATADGAMSSDPSASPDVASYPSAGSLDDYNNQGIDVEAASGGPVYIPVPVLVPNYAYLSPSPTVVSPRPIGPRFYQPMMPATGAYRGPGAYQSWTRGPGAFQPMTSGASFGPRSFGGGPGFGRR
jgi:hypothetical protein